MKHITGNSVYINGRLAIIIILIYILVALAAPLLAPPDAPDTPNSFRTVLVPASRIPNPPSADYPLGTVPLGRTNNHVDIYYTMIWGTRSALLFGFTATLLVSVFGTLVGAIGSFLGGAAGKAILYITDAFLAFPVIAGIVFFGQWLFPQTLGSLPGPLRSSLLGLGIDNVMLALICLGWMPYARVMYADMERVRQLEYVLAAQSCGAKPGRIILRHLIPNSISSVMVLATRDVSGLVLLQATFTFLGVGGNSDWGQLLVIGRNWILGTGGNPLEKWWVYLPVTIALIGFGIGWNLLGDFLNEFLNPKLRFTVTE